jgi:filamentous hemagglutinin family protein
MNSTPFGLINVSARRSNRTRSSLALLLAGVSMLVGGTAHAGAPLPGGGSVASGLATIATSASGVTVNQSTNAAIINWQGFSVGQSNAVTFNQPNAQSATLNRVTGTAPSTIAGQITSNGAVYLVNPNGIAITKTGSVQTGGGFVASTLDINDADFDAGKLNFAGKGASAAVTNGGSIAAGQGAYVALLGGSVASSGTITVPLGKVGLGSGEQIALDLNGGNFMQVGMPTSAAGNGALVDVSGSITAAGGSVILSAASVKSAVRNVVNLAGIISADSATGNAGSIQLLGGDGGTVVASGMLSARATGASGDGGSIETSGATVNFTGLKVDASAAHGSTGTWLIDPTDLTVDAAAAATIDSNLATANVTLQTNGNNPSVGPGLSTAGPGDININSALAWSSANTLTLDSYNNINLNAAINAPAGGLTLNARYIGNVTQAAPLTIGSFTLLAGILSQVTPNLPGFSATSFSVNSQNASFLRAIGGDGSSANPYQLADVYGLAGIGDRGLNAFSYVLANDIDASGSSGWNGGAGFVPIGSDSYTPYYRNTFTGNFDGKGHAIKGLAINSTDSNVGLFYNLGGNVSNLNLVGGNIVTTGSSVGGLAGYQSAGTITNVTSSVAINGNSNVGGLVGVADGNIVGSSASGAVGGTGSNIGGLVGLQGYQHRGTTTITQSFATGNVTDISGRGDSVGGLVGSSTGTIDQSYATGTVSGLGTGPGVGGTNTVGGLVGFLEGLNNGTNAIAAITNSYATGDVLGTSADIGGLVGQIYGGNVSNSYAKGKVSGTNLNVGGLIGSTLGIVGLTNVSASGAVDGAQSVGGLVGNAGANGVTTISDAHASGNVTEGVFIGNSGIGGLVGILGNTSSITRSDASGNVTDSVTGNAYGNSVGGLVGVAEGNVTYSHASGIVSGTNDTIGGLIGLIQYANGFADTNNYATGNVIGNTLPNGYFNGATIGGLIGAVNADGTIMASYATGTVSATQTAGGGGGTGNDQAGGLIGLIGNYVVDISKSYASGNVSVTGAVSTIDGNGLPSNTVSNRVGGLIGEVGNGHGLIDQVYASGNVVSDGERSVIGGLIGTFQDGGNGGVLSNAYATGSVTGLDHYPSTGPTYANFQYVGGLIGSLDSGRVANTYAVGRVIGNNQAGAGPNGGDRTGGLAAYASPSSSSISGSYFDTQTTGQVVSSGGTGLTTVQLQNLNSGIGGVVPYAGWDFSAIWSLPSGGYYPQLFALTPVVVGNVASGSRTYGAANPVLGNTVTAGGPASYVFGPSGDTLPNTVSFGTSVGSGANVGSYAVTPVSSVVSTGGTNYRVIGLGSGTLSVTPASLLVTYIANATSSTYGDAISALSGTEAATGLVNGDSLSAVTRGTAAFTTLATSTSNVGSYAITGAGLAGSSQNYNVSFVQAPGNATALTINPAVVTITNVSAALTGTTSKTYDGTTLAKLTPANFSLTGFKNSDGASVNQTVGTYASANAGTGINVTASLAIGNFVATGSTLFSNYVLPTSASGAIGTITPRSVSVTANSATKLYGAALPALTFTVTAGAANTGLVNGDLLGGSLATSATLASNVGSYAITQGTLGNPNYAVAYTGTNLAIAPAALLITYSATPTSSTYGNTVSTLNGTTAITGLVNGDTIAIVTSGTAGFTTSATNKSNVGSYAVTGNGITATSANYTSTTAQAPGNASALTITPRSVAVAATSASKVYGAALPTLTYTVAPGTSTTGLVNGDLLGGLLTTIATSASDVGNYAIAQGTLGNSNYSIAYSGSNLAITPASLLITYNATPTSSIYGNAIPTLTGTTAVTGLVNGDALGSVTSGTASFTTSATSKSNIGNYTITGSGLTATGVNYTTSIVQATGNASALTTTPRSITVTANPQSRYILLNNLPLTYTVGGQGLVNGDSLSGGLTTVATYLSNVGNYSITRGTLAATPNYSLTYIGSNLTVNPPPTQSLNAFLNWLVQVIAQQEARERACSAASVAGGLRTKGSVSFSKSGCGK